MRFICGINDVKVDARSLICQTGLCFFDQVGGEVEGGHLRAEFGEAAGGQAVAAGNVEDVRIKVSGPVKKREQASIKR